MLIECYNTPVKEMKVAAKTETKDGASAEDAEKTVMIGYQELEGCGTEKVESLAQTGDENVDAFYTNKLDQVDKLRMDLLYIVPSNTKALLETAPDVLAEAAEIRGKAEAALAAHENNPIASAAEKKKAKAKYEEVIAELDAVEALANQIMEDFQNVPTDASNLAQNVVTDLENFGKPSDEGAEGEGTEGAEGEGEGAEGEGGDS